MNKQTIALASGLGIILLVLLGMLSVSFGSTLEDHEDNQQTEVAGKLDQTDIQYSDQAIDIDFYGDSVSSLSNNVDIKDTTVTIKSSGIYRLSGTLEDGIVIVDVSDKGVVQLILDDVSITNTEGAAISVLQANGGTIIELPDGTSSVLEDGTYYVFDEELTEPNATLFSKDDLAITGGGLLTVIGNYNDAIASKDDLSFWDANVSVIAIDDGIRGKDTLTISNSYINVEAEDDGLKSDNENGEDGNIIIESGVITISAGDDGIHSEHALTIEDGDITISSSYEGLESGLITINGGVIDITSSDDGINVVAADSDETQGFMRGGEMASEGNLLVINDGTIIVHAGGDGLDSNGYMEMHGGTVTVFGPTNSGNGAIDVNGTFTITDGVLLAIGSSGMAEAPSDTSTQYSLMFNLESTYSAGSFITLTTADGEIVFEQVSEKSYASVVYSSPSLLEGTTYYLSIDGEEVASLVSESITSTYGTGGMQGGFRQPMNGTFEDREMPSDWQPPEFGERPTF